MYLAIIPAFNEEKSIATIIREIKKYTDHVVVVDDHSTDNTEKIARLHGATVIRHSTNKGVGAAMKTGIAYAKRLKPDIVVTMDADGQHGPDDTPSLIRPLIDGKADFVLGSRFLNGQLTDTPYGKKIGNKLFAFMVSLLVGVKLTDTQTGFRAFNRKALLSLNLASDFTYTQEMILVLCHNGFRCVEVPVKVHPRKYGQSKVVSRIGKYALKVLTIIFATYLRLKIQ
jgi:glycosyltransferase involved in cell wall biosynthesis